MPADVPVGFHLCYGDVEEAHFVQPKDASVLAEVVRGVIARSPRPIAYVHLPVPIERDDAAYYAPLADLEVPEGTDLYLGLLHHEDGVEGALRRIDAASTAVRGSASRPSAGSAAGRRSARSRCWTCTARCSRPRTAERRHERRLDASPRRRAAHRLVVASAACAVGTSCAADGRRPAGRRPRSRDAGPSGGLPRCRAAPRSSHRCRRALAGRPRATPSTGCIAGHGGRGVIHY